jgi:hypothetical protein
MPKEGFKEAKRKAISALQNGSYLHDTDRSQIVTKNLLFTGAVSSNQVCDLIKRSNGQDHKSSCHHNNKTIQVHVIEREGWYVKFYFIDPDTFFISVHQ